MEPNLNRVKKIGAGLDDPFIPYWLKTSMRGEFYRVPLYLYDTNYFQPVNETDPPLPPERYKAWTMFQDPLGQQGKTIIETNMTSEGIVPESEAWIVHTIETQIVFSHRLNIWQHQELFYAMAQGLLTLYLDERNMLEFPVSRSLVGTPPYLSVVSRDANDTVGSWPEMTPAKNSRMSDICNPAGFEFFDSQICMRPAGRFKVDYRCDPDTLAHLLEWMARQFPTDPHFYHDAIRFRVALRGRRFIPIQKPF